MLSRGTSGLWSNDDPKAWPYPYRLQVVARGFGAVFDFTTQRYPIICSIVKFFPLAWMCSVEDLPATEAHEAIRLDHLATAALDDSADIMISPSRIPTSRWPEAPRNNGVVPHNDLGTIGYPTRSPRSRKSVAVRLFGCSIHPVSETLGSFSSRLPRKSLQINVEPACTTPLCPASHQRPQGEDLAPPGHLLASWILRVRPLPKERLISRLATARHSCPSTLWPNS